MAWFSKKSKRIEAVPPEERVVKTENVFVKCDGCEAHLFTGELEDALQVCKHCNHHFRLGARERLRMLGVLDRLRAEPATRSAAAADAELRAIRAARRQGGRRTPQ